MFLFWLRASKPDRRQQHNVCFTPLKNLCGFCSVIQFPFCMLVIWSYYQGWHHKYYKANSSFSFVMLPNNALGSTSNESCTNRITSIQRSFLKAIEKTSWYWRIYLKKDPDVLLCWMSLIAHLKFKDMNPYLIQFGFFTLQFIFTAKGQGNFLGNNGRLGWVECSEHNCEPLLSPDH